MGVALEDEQVAANLDTAAIHKEVVGQTEGCEQVAVVHQPIAYHLIAWCIGDATAGDEGEDATILQLLHAFQEEVGVELGLGEAVSLVGVER